MKKQSVEMDGEVTQIAVGNLFRKFVEMSLRIILALLLGGFLSLVSVRGQQGNVAYPENAIDSRMRTSMRVDPTSGALQFQIALGDYPGRAGTGMPIMLYYSSKQLWQLEHWSTTGGCDQWQNCYPQDSIYGAYFADTSAAGWTSNLDWFIWQFWPSGSPIQVYDAEGRPADVGTSAVARMYVRLPDGSKHELRRDDGVWSTSGFNSSGVYYSVDGSRLRYHTDTQTLWLPDGSRYVGYLQYIDRHGNTLNYNGATRQWTDTLGRAISVPLPAFGTTGEQSAASARDEYYSIPGVGGASLTYTFKWRYLTDVRTDPAQALRSKGDRVNDYNCQRVPSLFLSPSLCGGLDEDHRIMSTTPFNPVVLHQIVFPNGSSYTFTYNIYGEIDKLVYPTGGYEKFTYDLTPELSAHFMTDQIWYFYAGGNRGVYEQRISPDGTQASEVLWQYTPGPVNWTTAPDGTRTERRVHQSQGQSIAHGFDDPRAGLAYDERVWAPNSGPMLRRKLTEWLVDGTVDYYGWRLRYKTRNPRPAKEVEIILDTGGNALAATTTFQYDADLNVISRQSYAFVEVDQSTAQTGAISSIPTGSLLRTEETDYLTSNQAYRDRNMLSLSTATRIKNPAGTIIAQSQTLYDEASYPLLTCGASTGWGDPGTSARGNATTSKAWLNTTGGWIQTHVQFDQCGSQRYFWDGKGNVSEVQYSSSYQFAYPTTSLSAVPDPTGQTGSSTPLTTSTSYDFYTGLVVSATDQNNQTTSFAYSDALNRLTTVTRPSGGGSTNYTYGDTPGNIYLRVQTSLDATRVIESYKYFDGLGRPHRSYLNEGGGNYLVTDTQFDNLGRVWRVSNPYRTTILNGAINPSGVWTTTVHDPLGRSLTVTTPDNAVVTTSYSGNTVTVTDQMGKKRKSVTDALGRLTDIYEDPTGVNYLTSYSYDVLDNLTTVSQGSPTRTFVYDSLKRLTAATNPESGTINYQYDDNSNLTRKTDARGIYLDYFYDALNRNTRVNYSNTPTINPDLTRIYDGAINGKGRFWYNYAGGDYSLGNNVEHTAVYSYDALGRPLIQRQLFKLNGVWGTTYQTQRGYNLAGGVTSQTYPSVRTISYSYDDAGRASSFSGTLGDGINRTYASGIVYSPYGGMSQEQLGTDIPIYNKLFYNARGQMSELRVGTSPNNDWWNRGAIINHYSDQCWGACWGHSMTDNNGNVKKQEVYVPDNEGISSFVVYTSWFNYDALNRLQYANGERWASGPNIVSDYWKQTFIHDRYGNRRIDPNPAQTYGAGVNNKDFTVDTSNNRLGVPSGQPGVMTYDNAGNLTNDTYTGTGNRTYDAENRITQAWGGNNQWQVYTYNADGQRVRRKVDGVEQWQVYGMDGELLAEYPANGGSATPQKEYGHRNGQLLITAETAANLKWLVADQLGTPRMILEKSGTLASMKRHDYLPFGEELFAGTGGRTTGQGYVGDNVRQKFNSKRTG